jgi:hypothetical protein
MAEANDIALIRRFPICGDAGATLPAGGAQGESAQLDLTSSEKFELAKHP